MTTAASGRTSFEVTHAWLVDFQADLVAVKNQQVSSQSYSIEQIAAGVEALIDIATGISELQGMHLYGTRYFSVNTSLCEEAVATVYDTVYQFSYWGTCRVLLRQAGLSADNHAWRALGRPVIL